MSPGAADDVIEFCTFPWGVHTKSRILKVLVFWPEKKNTKKSYYFLNINFFQFLILFYLFSIFFNFSIVPYMSWVPLLWPPLRPRPGFDVLWTTLPRARARERQTTALPPPVGTRHVAHPSFMGPHRAREGKGVGGAHGTAASGGRPTSQLTRLPTDLGPPPPTPAPHHARVHAW